ncbi:MAG: T9SS type A sorting domain-containing protein, partial [Ignavibacteria bacterium]|nr:T9SS type A sorting domain-containing protein [Ignavibacteria bacterium]
IPKDGIVTLKVYDILGREIKTLVNDFKTKGRYEVTFNADALASGLYIYEITSGDYKASKKMTLIK